MKFLGDPYFDPLAWFMILFNPLHTVAIATYVYMYVP